MEVRVYGALCKELHQVSDGFKIHRIPVDVFEQLISIQKGLGRNSGLFLFFRGKILSFNEGIVCSERRKT
jgi:hypothetical protein